MSLFFFGMFTWTTLTETPDYSDSERRVLAKFPEVSVKTLVNGDFSGIIQQIQSHTILVIFRTGYRNSGLFFVIKFYFLLIISRY